MPGTDIESRFPGRYVRVMCDHSADGVWIQDGSPGRADELPVAPDLIARIRAWQHDYEMLPEKPGGPVDQATFDALHALFARNGLEIACDLKAALPDWTVVYFDERKLTGSPDQSRAEFEYEITTDFAASWSIPRLGAILK
jgi:hypothetical protein